MPDFYTRIDMGRWIGSRAMVDQSLEFDSEVDGALREYRGPGIYKHTGERIAPLQQSYECREALRLCWITTEDEFDSMGEDDSAEN